MTGEKILHGFLEKLAKEAIEQIKKDKNLSQQNALPFLIQEQYSKIAHIKKEFVTEVALIDFKQEFIGFKHDMINKFAAIDERFESINDRFDNIEYKF